MPADAPAGRAILWREPPAPVPHGGRLDEARALFPHAPEPWIDLSTGISPHPFPLPPLDPALWHRLPSPGDEARLREAAAAAWGVTAGAIVAGAGTGPVVAALANLLPPGEAAVLAPTYAEHARLLAQAGHGVREVAAADALVGARLAVLVNPDNPSGRLIAPDALLALLARVEAAGGLLVVDEAFMDARPEASLAGHVTGRPLVVLRSFGKFYGLAGLRLGFAVADAAIAARLRTALGPWAVSGPALALGAAALADRDWADAQRARLTADAARLDALLSAAGLAPSGASPLFRTLREARAPALFERLGQAGLFTRRFARDPTLLRIGLPSVEGWERLEAALTL